MSVGVRAPSTSDLDDSIQAVLERKGDHTSPNLEIQNDAGKGVNQRGGDVRRLHLHCAEVLGREQDPRGAR